LSRFGINLPIEAMKVISASTATIATICGNKGFRTVDTGHAVFPYLLRERQWGIKTDDRGDTLSSLIPSGYRKQFAPGHRVWQSTRP
jgi:hypothetical protein